MDSMVSIFIFAFFMLGLILVKIINKSLGSPDHTQPKYDQKEAFPTIKPLILTEKQKQAKSLMEKKASPALTPKKEIHTETTAAFTMKEPASFSPNINLHSLNEARRAFIYSEIFNRKYE